VHKQRPRRCSSGIVLGGMLHGKEHIFRMVSFLAEKRWPGRIHKRNSLESNLLQSNPLELISLLELNPPKSKYASSNNMAAAAAECRGERRQSRALL